MLSQQNSIFPQDQAAGLRSMMHAPQAEVISILKTSSCDMQIDTITNLAELIVANGNKVLVLHAAHDENRLNQSSQ